MSYLCFILEIWTVELTYQIVDYNLSVITSQIVIHSL